MEVIITALVDRILVPLIEGGGAFAIFAILWAAFAYALVARPGAIDGAWEGVRSLPLVLQALVWLLLLPVMVGLWIWETTWPVAVRVILLAGIAGWNILIFLPKWLATPRA